MVLRPRPPIRSARSASTRVQRSAARSSGRTRSAGRRAEATIAPYIFGAASQGWIDDPTAVQPGHISAESFGVGLRMGADAATPVLPLGATFSIELARGFSNVAGEGQVYRCNVAFAVKF